MSKMIRLVLALVLLTVLICPGSRAQDAQVFYTGQQSFHYSQLFGPFNGDFSVAGEIDTTQWIPTLDQGIGGAIAAMDSTGGEQLLTMAVKTNVDTDTTWHVFGVLYRATAPIAVGAVPNASSVVQFFLLWNLDSLALPSELPDSLVIEDILGALNAEHKFIGAATSMTITQRDSTHLAYTFSGMAVDMDNTSTIITITNGQTSLIGMMMTAVEPVSPRARDWGLALRPNPFNPSTELHYTLPRAGAVELRVVDLLGREILRRSLGFQGAGSHASMWHAGGTPSGCYVVQVWMDGVPVASAKATLLK